MLVEVVTGSGKVSALQLLFCRQMPFDQVQTCRSIIAMFALNARRCDKVGMRRIAIFPGLNGVDVRQRKTLDNGVQVLARFEGNFMSLPKVFQHTSPRRLERILANSTDYQRLGTIQVKVERLKLCSSLLRVEYRFY
jgi:hypothetical protein